MANYYLPADDNNKSAFLNNFSSKLRGYQSVLNIDDATLQQVTDDAINFDLGLKASNSFQTFNKTVTIFKRFLKNGTDDGGSIGQAPKEPAMPEFTASLKGNIFGRLAKLVQTIKGHTNYTAVIERILGLLVLIHRQ